MEPRNHLVKLVASWGISFLGKSTYYMPWLKRGMWAMVIPAFLTILIKNVPISGGMTIPNMGKSYPTVDHGTCVVTYVHRHRYQPPKR
jgi:hypothetical protein